MRDTLHIFERESLLCYHVVVVRVECHGRRDRQIFISRDVEQADWCRGSWVWQMGRRWKVRQSDGGICNCYVGTSTIFITEHRFTCKEVDCSRINRATLVLFNMISSSPKNKSLLSFAPLSANTKPTHRVRFTDDAPSPTRPAPKLSTTPVQTNEDTLPVYILFHTLAIITALAALKSIQLAM